MAQASSQQGSLRRIRSKISIGGPITTAVVVIGLLLILFGAALQTGVWAGMLGIFGALLIAVAVVARLLIWLRRKV